MDARPRSERFIGNDVVDLGEPAALTALGRPRLIARVCCEQERARIAEAPTEEAALRLFWSHFAAKEAAYKAVSKREGPTVFAHRRFVVDAGLSLVSYGAHRLSLSLRQAAHAVHAVADLGPGGPPPHAEVVARDPADAPSTAARRALLATVAAAEGLDPADLEVFRPPLAGSWDGHGPPVLLLRGRERPDQLSLSHDGRYVAYAWLPCPGLAG